MKSREEIAAQLGFQKVISHNEHQQPTPTRHHGARASAPKKHVIKKPCRVICISLKYEKKETFGDLPPITKVRYYPYPQVTSIATRSGAAIITSANLALRSFALLLVVLPLQALEVWRR